MSSELRKADLGRIKGPRAKGAGAVGIVMDVYMQPQLERLFVQVMIGETINWWPESSCELVQRGSYVVE